MGFRTRFLQQATISVGTRVFGLGLAFLASMLLSRLLGLDGFGAYMIALGYALIASILVRLGCDVSAMRFAAVYRDQGQSGLLRGFVATALTGIVLAWTALTAFLFLAWLVGRPVQSTVSPLLAATAISMSLMLALSGVLTILLRTFDRTFESQLYEQVLRPLLLISFVGWALVTETSVTPAGAMALTACALGLPLGLMAWRVRQLIRSLPPQDRDLSDRPRWLNASSVLLLMALVQETLSQIDLILLGIFASNAEAGLFAAAQRLSSLATLGLVAIAMVAGPRLAAAFHRDDQREVAMIARFGARISFVTAVIICGGLVAGGPLLLELWGPEFVTAMPLVIVLLFGVLVGASTGFAGLLVVLTGHERVAMATMALTLVCVSGAETLLIPRLGAMGAAIGWSGGFAAWNLILAFYVRRKLGIDSSPIGRPPRR